MHNHKYHFHNLFNKELSELYASYTMRAFALALVSIFIPAYLLKLGYPLPAVLLFFLFEEIFGLGLVFVSAKLIEKIGLKHTMLLSVPFTITLLLLLLALKTYEIPLLVLSAVVSVSALFYWLPFHLDFCKISDKKERGMEYGIVNSLSAICIAFAPFVGASVISYYGFSPLYIISSVLIGVSMIPLFFTKDLQEKHKFNFKKFFSDQKKYAGIFIGDGFLYVATSIAWPIFIYLTLKNIMSLGIIDTASTFILALIPLLIGPAIDSAKKSIFLRIGCYGQSITVLIRGFLTNFTQIFILVLFASIFGTFRDSSFFVTFYNKANKAGALKFVVFREVCAIIGRCALLIPVIILAFNQSKYTFLVAFFFGALGLIIISRFKEDL